MPSFRHRISSGYWQSIFVGLFAFCGPGLFNALQGLGGAGNENPYYANTANATLYVTFALLGYLGGAAFNLLGNRVLIVFGGLTYAVYAATQYLASNVDSLGWVSIVGGIVLGVGAAWFWTAQGATILAYSTEATKGNYISTFWVIFNMGGLAGGFITFLVNYNGAVVKANRFTYFMFVAVMCCGPIAATFLLVPPDKVIREDGEAVVFTKAKGWRDEVKQAMEVAIEPPMLRLSVFFLTSNWYYTYHFNGVNGSLFNIRTRGLNSAFYWGAQMVGSVLLTRILDKKYLSMKSRAFYALMFIVVEFNMAWLLGGYVQFSFEGGYDKANKPLSLIDYKEVSRYIVPLITFLLYGIGDAAIQIYAYWCLCALGRHDTARCARYVGYYKGLQSAGAAIAWGLDLSDAITFRYQFFICVFLFQLSVVGAATFVWKLSKFDGIDTRTAVLPA